MSDKSMTCMIVVMVNSFLSVGSGLVEFGDSYVWAVDGSVSVHSGGREEFPERGVQVSLTIFSTVINSCCCQNSVSSLSPSDASCAVSLPSPPSSDPWLRTSCGSYWWKTLTRGWALDPEEPRRSSLMLSSRCSLHPALFLFAFQPFLFLTFLLCV